MGDAGKSSNGNGQDVTDKPLPANPTSPPPTTSRMTTRDGETDLEAQTGLTQTPQLPASITQSKLGSTYGMDPSEQPSHPPRHRKSTTSLRSKASHPQLIRLDSQAGIPPLPGQEDKEGLPRPPPTASTAPPPTANPDDNESLSEELAWGPQHPCYPHFNPHIPKSSVEYASTRVIRIKRDWMVVGDLAPTFSNLYPEILDPLLPEHQFRTIIAHINRALVQAFDPYSPANWFDGLLGLLTGWVWEDLRRTGVKGKLIELEEWISRWNLEVGQREGVSIIPLRRTGYMSLDVQIPDPQVRVVGDDERTNNGDEDKGTVTTGARPGSTYSKGQEARV